MPKSTAPTIGFLGAGKMATALARGWIQAKLVSAKNVLASDPIEEARKTFCEQTGGETAKTNVSVVEKTEVLILAVKPQDAPAVLKEIATHLDDQKHLLISIAAGVSLEQIAGLIGREHRMIRVMTNTPSQVGAGASAYASSIATTAKDVKLVDKLLGAVGKAFALPEKLLDAVTGLSGSGPAFVFLIIDALSDGGVRMGLPRDVATALATQTVFGAAKMVLQTGKHLGELKDMVTSPGGTTMAGIHALERGGLRAALIDAVEAATLRSLELGQQ